MFTLEYLAEKTRNILGPGKIVVGQVGSSIWQSLLMTDAEKKRLRERIAG
jgi:hypothetical protein